jgi:hypothetical protein
MGLDTKTYRLTDRHSQCDFDFDNQTSSVLEAVKENLVAGVARVLSSARREPPFREYLRPEAEE